MTNIEKYPNTKDALEAWSRARGIQPFSVWIQEDYIDQEPLTLLETAERFIVGVRSMKDLREAIIRERKNQKPVRNCDKYKTLEEAVIAFRKKCRENECKTCPFKDDRNNSFSCRFNWLYAKAEKEVSK